MRVRVLLLSVVYASVCAWTTVPYAATLHSKPAHATPAKRRVRMDAASSPPSELPGNYVQPYTMALGVSTSAILCAELVPGAGLGVIAATKGPVYLGRIAAISTLPLLASFLLALRSAAAVGPSRLRSETYQRLNLGVALSSLLAVVVSPRPPLSVVIARAGCALLCLEVWSQSSGSAGNPLAEMVTIVRDTVGSVCRSAQLMLTGGKGGVDTKPLLSRSYAILAASFGALAVSSLAAPEMTANALYPLAAPVLAPGRAASWASLVAITAYTLADAAARGRIGASTFRLLNLGLLLSCVAHLSTQLLPIIASGAALAISPLASALSVSTFAVGGLHVALLIVTAFVRFGVR
jgi:hypothetical protein